MRSILLILIAFLATCKAAAINNELSGKTFYELKSRYYAYLDCKLSCDDWIVFLDSISKTSQKCIDAYSTSLNVSNRKYKQLKERCEYDMWDVVRHNKKVKFIGREEDVGFKETEPVYYDDVTDIGNNPTRLCNYDGDGKGAVHINCNNELVTRLRDKEYKGIVEEKGYINAIIEQQKKFHEGEN